MRSKIFVVEDDELFLSVLGRAMRREGYEVETADSTRGLVERIEAWCPDVLLLDLTLHGGSGMKVLEEIKERRLDPHVVIITADNSADSAIKAMKLGASDYLMKPFSTDEVRIVVRNLLEKRSLEREVHYRRKLEADRGGRDIIGASPGILELKTNIEKLAEAGVNTVLITGESGTGKELVARYVHQAMHRDNPSGYAPFIGLNCTALPEGLIETELFGHVRGAFTDAKAEKKGVFELAQGGTLLLDEIGEMPQNLQAKLLRVLEERTLRRVGGTRDIPVELTVVSSTNRNLGEACDRREFRTDLFYRLSAFALHVPALRERGKDVLLLANHFLSHFLARYNKKRIKGFTLESEKILLDYRWPGNVRELRNVVERIVVLESAEFVTPAHLPRELTRGKEAEDGAPSPFVLPESGLSLEELKKGLMAQALRQTGGNKTQAARLLGISYDALKYQMSKLGLD